MPQNITILTINVPLILKESLGYYFFFAGKTYNGAFRYAQDNLGVKKVSAPLKNPQKCPIICLWRSGGSSTVIDVGLVWHNI